MAKDDLVNDTEWEEARLLGKEVLYFLEQRDKAWNVSLASLGLTLAAMILESQWPGEGHLSNDQRHGLANACAEIITDAINSGIEHGY